MNKVNSAAPSEQPTPAIAPPSPSKVILAIALVAGFAELAYAVLNISAMPVYLKYSLGYGETRIALIGTAFLVVEGLMKGPFGLLGDRVGRKWLMVAGPFISACTSLLTLLVHPNQGYLFAALRILDGLGAAALWPSAMAMIADVVAEERRGQAISLFNVTYLVGLSLGPLLGGAANTLMGFFTQVVPNALRRHYPRMSGHIHEHFIDPHQASFYLVSILFVITGALAWWRLPKILPHRIHHEDAGEPGFSFKALLASLRLMPAMLAMTFITFLGIGLVMLIIKLFAMAEYNVSELTFGKLLLVPSLVIAAVSVPLGTLGDKIGRVKAVRIGVGLCAASLWALILMKSEWAVVIGGSTIGIGFVISFPAWMAHISTTCRPQERGAIMGAVGTAQGLGAMMGAPLGGYLYEHANIPLPFIQTAHPSHYVPFIGCALLLLVSLGLSFIALKDKKKPSLS